MSSLFRGPYHAREAFDPSDLRRAQALRWRAFRPGAGQGLDADGFDTLCRHILVEETATGQLVCCYRILPLADPAEIARSYAARRDADILRVAWAAMTAIVEDERVDFLFGCSSFAGTDPAAHLDAFSVLKDRHLAPQTWRPRVKAPQVFRFARRLGRRTADPVKAARTMPPLLRAYLGLGGWVSDHAVVDPDLGTLHVFTGIEIGRVPPRRALSLRMAAGRAEGDAVTC
jgi:putative hemolysin